ncbi:tetratricopeptide repeat protein [Planococcus lenghuensis]|uniref:Uncharacterized protein n=1 Tax=Planococcus lenghuensis TaxID=2213202 RepID=A0A1Q2L2P4_9BACL|nr:hypothetical protein [Planococcus lenghuensis]AQQ54162.1 hypothetical protein B0X71_14310 [Planococcus lenghuensis]
MEQLSKRYNQAVALVQEDKLEEAKWILQSILASAPFHSGTNWLAGLVEVMMGNPVAGLTHWERVKIADFPQLPERREQVLSTLRKYEEIRAIYNHSLSLVRERKLSEARSMMVPLLNRDFTFPLPADVYRLYFLILAEQGQTEEAFSFILDSPPSIQKTPSIIRFVHALRDELLREETAGEWKKTNEIVHPLKTKKGQRRMGATAIAIVAAFIGGTYIVSQIDTAEQESAFADQQELDSDSEGLKEVIDELESKLISLESEKEILQEELGASNERVSEYEATEKLFKEADLDLTSLRTEEAKKEYDAAYALYQNGEYIKAKERFELSLQLSPSEYFSDDSLYYLIRSTQQLSTLTGDSELLNQFLTSESEHFLESPYQDDLLVIQADAYHSEGKKDEALLVLSQIQDEYPSEWTATYAEKLLDTMQEKEM